MDHLTATSVRQKGIWPTQASASKAPKNPITTFIHGLGRTESGSKPGVKGMFSFKADRTEQMIDNLKSTDLAKMSMSEFNAETTGPAKNGHLADFVKAVSIMFTEGSGSTAGEKQRDIVGLIRQTFFATEENDEIIAGLKALQVGEVPGFEKLKEVATGMFPPKQASVSVMRPQFPIAKISVGGSANEILKEYKDRESTMKTDEKVTVLRKLYRAMASLSSDIGNTEATKKWEGYIGTALKLFDNSPTALDQFVAASVAGPDVMETFSPEIHTHVMSRLQTRSICLGERAYLSSIETGSNLLVAFEAAETMGEKGAILQNFGRLVMDVSQTQGVGDAELAPFHAIHEKMIAGMVSQTEQLRPVVSESSRSFNPQKTVPALYELVETETARVVSIGLLVKAARQTPNLNALLPVLIRIQDSQTKLAENLTQILGKPTFETSETELAGIANTLAETLNASSAEQFGLSLALWSLCDSSSGQMHGNFSEVGASFLNTLIPKDQITLDEKQTARLDLNAVLIGFTFQRTQKGADLVATIRKHFSLEIPALERAVNVNRSLVTYLENYGPAKQKTPSKTAKAEPDIPLGSGEALEQSPIGHVEDELTASTDA